MMEQVPQQGNETLAILNQELPDDKALLSERINKLQTLLQENAVSDQVIFDAIDKKLFEAKVAAMKLQTQEAIDDLLEHLNYADSKPNDADMIEILAGNIANDLDSLRTLRVKQGEESATVAQEVEHFPSLNNPLLTPLKEALLVYGPDQYGAPLLAAKQLAEAHRKLVNRTQAEAMGV